MKEIEPVLRRNLSGIYIFAQLEGDEKNKPTCIEDCPGEVRREWLKKLSKEGLISCIAHCYDCILEILGDTELCLFDNDPDEDRKKREEVLTEFGMRKMSDTSDDLSEHQLWTIADSVVEKLRYIGDVFDIKAVWLQ